MDGPELRIVNDSLAEIPPVRRDTQLEQQAAQKPGTVSATQTAIASKAMLKYAFMTVNLALVGASSFVTKGRVSNAAALDDAEIEALAAVWSPLVNPASPVLLAAVTTMGILSAKVVQIWTLNREAKGMELDTGNADTGNGTGNGTGNAVTGNEPGSEGGGALVASSGDDKPGDAPGAILATSPDAANGAGNRTRNRRGRGAKPAS